MGFVQSKLKELQLLSFLENSVLIFYLFLLFLNKMLIFNNWESQGFGDCSRLKINLST